MVKYLKGCVKGRFVMRYEEDVYTDDSLYKTMNAYRGRREVKIAMTTAAMLVFLGLALGVVLYRISGNDIDVDADSVIGTYFRGMFAQAHGAGDKLGVILFCFYHEIAFPALVFVLGYTVFAPIFSAALCVWKAAVCGFAICMLEFTTQNGIFVESLIYLICQIAIISVDVSVAMRAFFYSSTFCADNVRLADVFKRDDSRAYFFDFIISAGVLFIAVTLTLVLINFI